MIDPSLCAEAVAGWGATSWRVFRWLSTPSQVIPILLVPIALPWLTRSKRKWQWSGLGMLLLVGYLFVASPIGIAAGNQLLVNLLPRDGGDRADAIVVLGRGGELRPQRVQTAADLWKAGRAPIVFASGRGDATAIVKNLEAKGVPTSALDGEPCSRTTEENALFTTLMLRPRHAHRIVLITDAPHMLRSLLTFRSLGFDVIAHPSPLPIDFGIRKRAFLVFREYLGLVSYSALGRFWPRDVPADTMVTQKLETGDRS